MAKAKVLYDKKTGQAIYPYTDASLIIGLKEGFMDIVEVDTLPTASKDTRGKLYFVPSENEGEYDRYVTKFEGGAYTWQQLTDTTVPSPTIADNLTTNDATKALSAKQGKVLDGKVDGIDQKIGMVIIPITQSGKYVNTNAGVGNHIGSVTGNSSWSYMRFPVSAGDYVIVNGTGGSGPRLWAFIDEEEIILSVADASVTASNLRLVAPENAAEVIINTNNTSVPSYYLSQNAVQVELERFGLYEKKADALNPSGLITENDSFVTIVAGKFVNSTNGQLVEDSSGSPSANTGIPVIPNTKIRLFIPNVPYATGRGADFYDKNGNHIEGGGVPYVVGQSEYIIDVPSAAVSFALTTFNNEGFILSFYTKDVDIYKRIDAKIEEKGMSLDYDLSNESFVSGYFFNVSTKKFVAHNDYGYYKIYFIPGTKIVVTQGFTNSALGIGFFDRDGACLDVAGYSTASLTAVVPSGTEYAIVTKSLLNPFSLKLLYNDVNVINDLLYNPGKPSGNPLAKLGAAPSFISIFKKIVHIGDSLTRGQYNTTSPNTNGADLPGCSRPVFMGRMIGNENVNLGIGGAAAALSSNHPWITEAQEGYSFPWTDFTNPGDCYIIALGTNDISQLGSFTGDVSTDIDTTDYHNNATTSVGGYATIIQMILEMQPKAKIFCVTIPKSRNTESTRTAANTKIKAIAQLFNCYVIDLETYGESESGYFATYYKNDTHNNALGYLQRARQYIAYIDWIIENNPAQFRNLQFIGTDFDYE